MAPTLSTARMHAWNCFVPSAFATPGWNRLARALTFSPDSSSCPAWLPWKEEVFATILWPRIAEARSACAAGDLASSGRLRPGDRFCSARGLSGAELSCRPVPDGALLGAEVRETLASLPCADRFRRSSRAPGDPLCVARERSFTSHRSRFLVPIFFWRPRRAFPEAEWTFG